MSWRAPKNIYEARDFARREGELRARRLKRFKMRWEPAFQVGSVVRLRFENWNNHAIGPFGVVIGVRQTEKWSHPHYRVHVWLERLPGHLDFTQPGYDEAELEPREPTSVGGRNYGNSAEWMARNPAE